MTTITSLSGASHPREVVRYEEEGIDWVLETMGESAPKYRQTLLEALAQLKPHATTPPPVASSSSRSPS
jgi:hypothetical protein